MPDQLISAETTLIAALQASVRGPKRNGLFALWLMVRVCEGLLPPDPVSLRGHRRRLEGLSRRLSSLSLSPGLRRLLNGCVGDLASGTAATALAVLEHLLATLPDQLGTEAAAALELAVQAGMRVMHEAELTTEVGV